MVLSGKKEPLCFYGAPLNILSLGRNLKRWVEHFLWPVECPVCGRIASTGCLSCLENLIHNPIIRELDGDLTLMSGSTHHDTCRDLVLRLKYRGWGQLGVVMGQALAKVLPPVDCDALVPIPLHKQSRRPWNQAKLIAKGIAMEWRVPVVELLVWNPKAGFQTSYSSIERRLMAENALVFKGVRRGRQQVRAVVLIDDVSTTGTTLRRAACTLREHSISVKKAITWSTSLRYYR